MLRSLGKFHVLICLNFIVISINYEQLSYHEQLFSDALREGAGDESRKSPRCQCPRSFETDLDARFVCAEHCISIINLVGRCTVVTGVKWAEAIFGTRCRLDLGRLGSGIARPCVTIVISLD